MSQTYTNVAGNALLGRLKYILKNTLKEGDWETMEKMPYYVWEKIKTEACTLISSSYEGRISIDYNSLLLHSPKSRLDKNDDFSVHTSYSPDKNYSFNNDYSYHMTFPDDYTITIPEWIRKASCDVLFEGDEDGISIGQCVIQCLSKVGLYRNKWGERLVYYGFKIPVVQCTLPLDISF